MKAEVVDILSEERIPLVHSQHVEFGEGDERVTVLVRDGAVEISAARSMLIIPRTNNVIRVRSTR